MQPESTPSGIDLAPFWTEYDQVRQEYDRLAEVQAARDFWNGFADDLVTTRDFLDRAAKEMKAQGMFGGLAAQRFYDRLDAGTRSIEPWLMQDIRSVGFQLGDVEGTVNASFKGAENLKGTLFGLGVKDHQMRMHQSLWSGHDQEFAGVLELMQARRDDVRSAFTNLTRRLEAITEQEWRGFGSQSAGQLSGTAYDQGVTVLADPLKRQASDFTRGGTKPAAANTTIFYAYPLGGPLGTVANRPAVLRSGAAVRFQNRMHDGMRLAGTTLGAVVTKFNGLDGRSYLEILQGLG